MSNQSAISQATRVLAAVDQGARADVALREHLAGDRRLSPAEKRAVTRTVFAYFRWLRWLDPQQSPPQRLAEALKIQARFDADEKSAKPEALAARAVPDWLWSELEFPTKPDGTAAKTVFLRQLQREPALWLRARLGQAAALAQTLTAAPTPRAPDALRYTGALDLFRTEQFRAGEFEIQDLASQLVGLACAPHPGETWWDACAGEGGKTLHLCDLMGNKGTVWATDRHTGRLETLKRRAARAKLFNYRAAPWDGSAKLPTKTKFDGVLVDAPCSGVGTWQRNPHARWTTTPDDVRELAVTQLALLDHVAGSLKPGGRLAYSVCTLTRSETSAVAAAFTAAHPELEPSPVFGSALSTLGSELSTQLTLWPHELNANGMFIAAWKRKI
jgi:16S rRNA (cytosine967-C5)-methyltransferase